MKTDHGLSPAEEDALPEPITRLLAAITLNEDVHERARFAVELKSALRTHVKAQTLTFDEWLESERPAGCVADMERGWKAAVASLSAVRAPDAKPIGKIIQGYEGALLPVWNGGTPVAGPQLYAQAPGEAPEVPVGTVLVSTQPTPEELVAFCGRRTDEDALSAAREAWAGVVAVSMLFKPLVTGKGNSNG